MPDQTILQRVRKTRDGMLKAEGMITVIVKQCPDLKELHLGDLFEALAGLLTDVEQELEKL